MEENVKNEMMVSVWRFLAPPPAPPTSQRKKETKEDRKKRDRQTAKRGAPPRPTFLGRNYQRLPPFPPPLYKTFIFVLFCGFCFVSNSDDFAITKYLPFHPPLSNDSNNNNSSNNNISKKKKKKKKKKKERKKWQPIC